MRQYIDVKLSWFKLGQRVYDCKFEQIGIVYDISDFAVHVAFPENISLHPEMLKYCKAYESKFFIKGSRLQMVDEHGRVMDLEEFFELI